MENCGIASFGTQHKVENSYNIDALHGSFFNNVVQYGSVKKCD